VAGRKKKVDALNMILGQIYFNRNFFEVSPQCKGCDYAEEWCMDWEMYNRIIRKKYCSECKRYTGAGWDDVDEITWERVDRKEK